MEISELWRRWRIVELWKNFLYGYAASPHGCPVEKFLERLLSLFYVGVLIASALVTAVVHIVQCVVYDGRLGKLGIDAATEN